MKKIITVIFSYFIVISCANAFTVAHDFDVFIGAFNASRTNFAYSISDDEYAVNSDIRTHGIFDTLYPFQAIYSTTGKMTGKELLTTNYKYTTKSRSNTRSKELIYDNYGKPVKRITSKNGVEKTDLVNSQNYEKGTTDLQTVIAELVLQYNKDKSCNTRMEVFDGKRRFDVVFKDEGSDVLKKNKYSPLEGQASKCSMYVDTLGAEGDDLLMKLSSDRPIYFWIMENENNRPYIARLEIKDTPYGKVSVYTRKVKIEE